MSAPAGFGKTTLVSGWLAGCERPAAWMSLDEGDRDPARFLTYLIAALRTVAPQVSERMLGVLQSPQPPPIEAILTTLLNDITANADAFVLVLDDYHAIEAQPVDQVVTLLRQGQVPAAAQLAWAYDLPISRARVHLAQADPDAALAALEPWRQQVEARGWVDEQLKVLVLRSLALRARGEKEQVLRQLGEALALAEPEECIRTFIDEGPPMARMLAAAAAQGMMPTYVGKLLAIFAAEKAQRQREATADLPFAQPLIEPLSQREREILQLIAQGLSNAEIGERLFLALDTVKGHNRKTFGKLQVQRRTEAVALARELGLVKALLETGKVVPVVDGRYALSETAATMRHVEGTSKARS